MSIAEAEIGHNNPPSPIDQDVERLSGRASQLKDAGVIWIDERPEIVDQDQADKCSDYLNQIKAFEKDCDHTRKSHTDPLFKQQKEIKATFDAIPGVLGAVKKTLEGRLSAFLRKERERKEAERRAAAEKERLAREEAERKAREAEEQNSVAAMEEAEKAKAAAEEAEKQRKEAERQKATAKGGLSSRAMSLRKVWHARVLDHKKALEHYANHDLVMKAVEQAAEQDAKAHKEQLNVPGVESYYDEKPV